MNLKPLIITGAMVLTACAPGGLRKSLDEAGSHFASAYDSQKLPRSLIKQKVEYALSANTVIEGDCRTHAELALALVKRKGYDAEIIVIKTPRAPENKLHAVVAVRDGQKVWILDSHYPWPIRLSEHPGKIIRAYD